MISKQTQLLITSRTTKLSLKIRLTLQAQPRLGMWETQVYLDNVWLRARPERERDSVKERRWLRETGARERYSMKERWWLRETGAREKDGVTEREGDGVIERNRDGERERDDMTIGKNQNVKEV